MSSYEPRGRMIDLMAAVRAEPQRLFKAPEVAAILHCKNFPSTINQYLYAAIAGGLIHKRLAAGEWYFKGSPVTDADFEKAGIAVPSAGGGLGPRLIPSPAYSDKEAESARADVRAPRVDPAWTPPKMVPPRASSEPARAPLPEPMHRIIAPTATPAAPPLTDEAEEDLGLAIRAQNKRVNTLLADRLAKASAPAAAPEPEPELEGEAESEALDFSAALWTDGELVLYGLVELEDGGHRLDADHVPALKRLLAGVPG